MTCPALALADDEAHLWYLRPERIDEPALFAAYEDLLLPEERSRRERYLFERGQREYLLTRALVRCTLSRYASIDPAAWTFRANEYGRPEIAVPDGQHPLRFNLSNTDGLIVCLVAVNRDVGVDVEAADRAGQTVEIADRFFSPSEVTALRALPPEQRRERFFEYWTLKEAYIKARGMGLAIPLHQFSFVLEPPAPVRIAFDPRLMDQPADWQFAQFRPTLRHHMAVAIRRGADPDLRIVVRETVPLQD